MNLRSHAIALAIAGLVVTSCSKSPVDPNRASWRVLPGHVESFRDPGFRAGRQCWVYLPPSYTSSGDRYPVLYATDGENMFDGSASMHVNRICEDLIRQGEIRPIIIVAIENVSRDQRFFELPPWSLYYPPQGDGGVQFLQAIEDTLKPAIDRHYRTLKDPANTAIAGVSLGGVFAAYAGIMHSEAFGNVAAFSPSYWVDGNHVQRLADSVGYALPGRIHRYYQDTGTGYDNSIFQMERALVHYGFLSGDNLLSITATDGEHVFGAWEHRYPEMLKFLFPPK